MPASTTRELSLKEECEVRPAGRKNIEARVGFLVVPERSEAKESQN